MEKITNQSKNVSKKTIYSLAIADFKMHIKKLTNFDKEFASSLSFLDKIEENQNKIPNLEKILRNQVFVDLNLAKKYIKKVKNEIAQYKSELFDFLLINQDKREEFKEIVNNLNNLIDEKTDFINSTINRCYNLIKMSNYNLSSID